MQVLLVPYGTLGDIYPYVPLGLALKKRGHRVTIISSEYYKHFFINEGLDFVACGTAGEYKELVNNPDVAHPFKGVRLMTKYVMLDPMKRLYSILANYSPANTVIAASPFAIGARLTNEKHKIPLASICLQPAAIWSTERPPVVSFMPFMPLFYRLPKFLKKFILKATDRLIIDRVFSKEVNQFRTEIGLPAIKHIYSQWLLSHQQIIGLFPDWFAHPAPDWPEHTVLTGFLHYIENAAETLTPEIISFIQAAGPEPPIVFTYGTSMAHAKEFFATSIAAAAKLNRHAIVVTPFAEQLPENMSENIMHVPYVPFVKLLPHVAAIVHHGGIGTMSHALIAGVPQLVIPYINDQFDNAYWLKRLKAGVMLTKRQYHLHNVVNALDQLLHSAIIREECTRFATKVDFKKTERLTCELIEQLGGYNLNI